MTQSEDFILVRDLPLAKGVAVLRSRRRKKFVVAKHFKDNSPLPGNRHLWVGEKFLALFGKLVEGPTRERELMTSPDHPTGHLCAGQLWDFILSVTTPGHYFVCPVQASESSWPFVGVVLRPGEQGHHLFVDLAWEKAESDKRWFVY